MKIFSALVFVSFLASCVGNIYIDTETPFSSAVEERETTKESALLKQTNIWDNVSKRIAEYSIDNLIVLTICNMGMASQWLQQWYVSARLANIQNIIVFATDKEAYDWIYQRIGDRVFYASELISLLKAERWSKLNQGQELQSSSAYNWRSVGYESVVTQRATILKKIMQETTVNVLYTDTDIHWIKNPIETLTKYARNNICLQREKGDEIGDYNCSGVLFLLNSRVTLEFLRAWEQYIRRRAQRRGFFTDQEEVNNLLNDIKSGRKSVDTGLTFSSNFSACTFGWDEFPSGINLFSHRHRGKGRRDKTCKSKICKTTVWSPINQISSKIDPPDSAVLVHHNFAKSNQIKIQRAKKYGFWLNLRSDDWFE